MRKITSNGDNASDVNSELTEEMTSDTVSTEESSRSLQDDADLDRDVDSFISGLNSYYAGDEDIKDAEESADGRDNVLTDRQRQRTGRRNKRISNKNNTDDSDNKQKPDILPYIISFLCIVFVSSIPPFILYVNNVSSMTFSLILKPIGISILIGCGIFVILRFLLKNAYRACIVTSAVLLLFLNFSALRSVTNTFLGSTISTIVTILLILYAIAAIAYLCTKLINDTDILKKISMVMAVTFFGIIVYNFISSYSEIQPKLTNSINKISNSLGISDDKTEKDTKSASKTGSNVSYLPEIVELSESEKFEGKPNLYYFILDEYGSFDMLKKYYNYDNAQFRSFLIDHKFNISDTSYSTSTISQVCIAEVLRLNPLPMSKHNLQGGKEALKDVQLFKVLKNLGYTSYQMSTQTNMFRGTKNLRNMELYGDAEPETEDGDTVEDIIAQQSIFQIFNQEKEKEYTEKYDYSFLSSEETLKSISGKGEVMRRAIQNRLDLFDFFSDPDTYKRGRGIAIFSYVCSPHVPFIFTSDGHSVNTDNHRNWSDRSYYLGQLEYVSKRLMKIIETIEENDPNSIIVIQSDHGIRNHSSEYRPRAPKVSQKDAMNIFNVVYYKGQVLDIEGKSAMNTMRYILSEEFGLDYPQI